MKSSTRNRILTGGLAQLLAVATLVVASQGVASAAPWGTGDVFTALSDGQYRQYTSAGAPLDTLQVSTPGYFLPGTTPPNSFRGFTGQCAFNPALAAPLQTKPEDLYTTLWNENQIAVVDSTIDPHPVKARIDTSLGGTLTGHPQSIVFDSVGDFYVGLVDGAAGEVNLLKYSRNHPNTGAVPTATYVVPRGAGRGVAAMSLTANNDVIYYTTQDNVIRTYNVVTSTAGANFTTNQTLSTLYGIRILQGGSPFAPSGDGFLMVADYSFNGSGDTGIIRVFNATGSQVNTYGGSGTNRGWFSLSVKSGGNEFVAGDFRTGNMVTFGAAGQVSSFNVTNQPFRLNGSCVKGEQTPGVVPFPSDGFFIVGDVSAGFDGSFDVGNTVYFWGNDWATNNTLSGVNGSNQSSFKGFAETTNPAVPNCATPTTPAATFESGGGASSAPPAVLPNKVAVIVVSTMGKTGSVKANGSVRAILLVQVNQGTYNNASGGLGTGTVVQLVCGS